MNRALLIAGSVVLAGIAFAAGRILGNSTGATDVLQDAFAPKPASLDDPDLRAKAAREQLAELPQTLWVAAPPDDPARVDGLALTTDVPVMPAVPGNASAAAPKPPTIAPALSADQIAGLLSRTIAAVKRSDGVASVIVIDNANGIRRTLKVGDLYRDGWRVELIDTQSITLGRKSAKAIVPVGFGLRRPVPTTPYLAPAANTVSSAGIRSANPGTRPASSRPRRRIARPGTSDEQK
ncbi:hypothetical protein [Porphyrobacter sp. AAP82]|uniref:hypothetical protein n=1 Tax=Porphyrobacter sp. AAP82 TaxID=1248917 RepID=UPI0012DD8ABF|nr:hypothetical protein [Porphyrobacter sp. AAP82]